jgi:hypothetical protein
MIPYQLGPGGGNVPWTVRLILKEEVPHDALTADIAARSQQTPAAVEAVIRAMLTAFGVRNANGEPIRGYLDQLNSIPTAGGNFSSPDESANADTANLTLSLSLTREANSNWRSGVSLQKEGIKGLVVPIVDSVVDKANSQANHYTVGNVLDIRGDNLAFDPADATFGVYLQSVTTGARVRVTVYATVTSGTILCVVPTGVSGQQRLVVRASVNGAIRESIYTEVLAG